MRKPDALKLLGERIATLRHSRGLTQEQLAERMGMSRNHVADIELGARNTGVWSFLLVARALEMDAADLFADFPAAAVRRLR